MHVLRLGIHDGVQEIYLRILGSMIEPKNSILEFWDPLLSLNPLSLTTPLLYRS